MEQGQKHWIQIRLSKIEKNLHCEVNIHSFNTSILQISKIPQHGQILCVSEELIVLKHNLSLANTAD
jgi:hypothetical protein